MILFLAACSFAVFWGLAENRLFKEQGEWRFLGHFKVYHVFLAMLIFLVAFLGAEVSVAKFAFLVMWSVLGLDVIWWLKRYWDFTNGYGHLYSPEQNAWHQKEDWDNWLGLPLVFGVYWWWVFFAGMLTVIALFCWINF